MWTFIVRNGGVEEASPMLHIWNVKSVTLQTPILDGIKSWYLKKIPRESASRPILLGQASEWIHTLHASEIRRSPPNRATFPNINWFSSTINNIGHVVPTQIDQIDRHSKNHQELAKPCGFKTSCWGWNIKKRRPLLATKKPRPPSCIRSLS